MDVYVIVFPNVDQGIVHTVFKSYNKAMKMLYDIKERLNAEPDDVGNLFYHTPYEVDEEKGIVWRSVWFFNTNHGKKEAKQEIAAKIHSCVVDEEE